MTDEPTNDDLMEPGGPVPGNPDVTGPPTGEPSTGEPPTGGPLPPGAPMPAAPQRRLVRDPYSRLGGVASGVAHYYGLDVSLVRLLFLLLALSTGVGLVAYLVAWLIIPRAEYWPPAGPARSPRSLSNRDLGIGLAVVGVLVAVALGGGGSFFVPAVLIGGGIWLLVQPNGQPAPLGAGSAAFSDSLSAASPTAGPVATAPVGTGLPPNAYQAPMTAPAGLPVPRRRRRRRVIAAALGFLTLLIVVPLVLIVGLIIAVARGTIDVQSETVRLTPASLAELPLNLDKDQADVIIDLTDLDPAALDELGTPAVVDVRVDFGRIEVIVPEGIDTTVDATAGLGSVEVFGSTEDGIRPDINRTASESDLDLRLDVGAGEVVVHRA